MSELPPKLPAILEMVWAHPASFLGRADDPQRAETFIDGFRLACQAFGHDGDPEAFRAVWKARGWERRGTPLVRQMRERGMSESEIVQELLAIEVAYWRRVVTEKPTEDGTASGSSDT
jgi:hypothetical protein